MGYYTYCTFQTLTGAREEQDIVAEKIAKALDCDVEELDNQYIKWYNASERICEIAKEHPSVMIQVDGDGEESLDIWTLRLLGSKSELVQAEIPPFRELTIEGE